MPHSHPVNNRSVKAKRPTVLLLMKLRNNMRSLNPIEIPAVPGRLRANLVETHFQPRSRFRPRLKH